MKTKDHSVILIDGKVSGDQPLGTTDGSVLAVLYGLFFFSGFSALAYQVTWQRMLALFAGSDSISVTLIVGAFLLGLGGGSMLSSRLADRLTPRGAIVTFALCELGTAAFALVSKLYFYDFLFTHMPELAGNRPLAFIAAFIGLFIPTTLMGMTLPLLAKSVVRRIHSAAERIGNLYGANTLGAACGAFITGCFLIGTIGYVATIVLAALLNISVAIGAMELTGFRGHFPLGGERSTNGKEAPSIVSAGLPAEGRRARPIGTTI